MTYQHILLAKSDGVAIVTLNRPSVLNAINMRRLPIEYLPQPAAATPTATKRTRRRASVNRDCMSFPH